MSLFKTVNERRILNSPTEPTSRSWLWLKTENGTSTLYDFVNGAWTPVNGFSDKDTGHGSEYGGDIHNDADYVTWNGLNEILDKNLDTVSTWLSGYLKEADLEQFITEEELDDAVASSVNKVLAKYQTALVPGDYITLTPQAGGGGTKIDVKVGGLLSSNSGPVSGREVYRKFDQFDGAKQDKLIPGVTIRKIRTVGTNSTATTYDLLDMGSVDVQAPIPNLPAVISGAAAGATAVQQNDLADAVRSILRTVNNNTLVKQEGLSDNITIQGGDGTGTSVTVLDPGEAPSSNSGVYFFADSPSQVEGDYNSLLQTAGFSPGNLYYLSPAKRIENGVEEGYLGYNVESNYKTFEGCTVRNNIIYYNGQSTGMKEYGDIIVSNSIKVADTSDTADISFMVSCPFAANSTVVRVSVVQGAATLKYLYSNKDWRNVPSAGFTFSNTGNGRSYTIKVTNTSTNYKSKRVVVVRLSNPANGNSVDIRVVYPATRVFFKNGSWPTEGITLSSMQAYKNMLRANSDCRTESITYGSGSESTPITGGTLHILHPINKSTISNPNNCYVGIYYTGNGTLTATVNGNAATIYSTEHTSYYYIMIGNYKGSETVVSVTASESGFRSKTRTVTWSASYNDELPPIQSRYIYSINSVLTDANGVKYLSIGNSSGSGRQHCILANNIDIDLSKMNVFYIVSSIYSDACTWYDPAVYVKEWWGRFADDSELNSDNKIDIVGHAGNNTGRSCMFDNGYYLPSTQVSKERVKHDIDCYGHYISKCYSTDVRRGGVITGDLYFSFLNASGIIYEFGIMTYDYNDLLPS